MKLTILTSRNILDLFSMANSASKYKAIYASKLENQLENQLDNQLDNQLYFQLLDHVSNSRDQ